jgi:glycosyltransferase involved in cell wall biosynthesis
MEKIDIFVSVVAPLKEDEAVVGDFIAEVTAKLAAHYTHYELVLVDDGSEDQTVAKVESLLSEVPFVRLIELSHGYGIDTAITAGLDSAIGDYVVVMVPESDPVDLIVPMVEKCRQGCGIVRGLTEGKLRMSLLARLFYGYVKHVAKLDLSPRATYFQAFSRQAVNAMTRIRDRYRHVQLFSLVVGFRTEHLDYRPISRSGKDLGRSFIQKVNIAVTTIVTHSQTPLRFVSFVGLAGSFLNLLYVLYVILIFFFKSRVAEGWTSVAFQQGFMFLLVFVILTVISEYLGGILSEVRERPLYFVAEEKNSSVLAGHDGRNIAKESDR